MKLKLFHKLFLLVAVTALVAALAMASVMAWNLSRGFAGYLQSRDVETMETYAGLISRKLDERGGVAALETGSVTLAGRAASISDRKFLQSPLNSDISCLQSGRLLG